MKVLVTGSDGFIGKNLLVVLAENSIDHLCFTRDQSIADLPVLLEDINFVSWSRGLASQFEGYRNEVHSLYQK